MSTGFQVGSIKRKDRASTMLNPKSTGNICAAPDESSYLAGTSDVSSSFARPCGPHLSLTVRGRRVQSDLARQVDRSGAASVVSLTVKGYSAVLPGVDSSARIASQHC